MSTWIKLKGTQGGNFQLGFTGPVLQNSSGNLDVKNSSNTGYVDFTAGNIIASGGVFSGNAAGLTSIPGANIIGVIGNATVAETVSQNAQPNITSLGTLANLSVTGNLETGTLLTNNIKYANGESYQFTTNAAGSNTQVQFNNNNNFNASSNFTFSTDTNILSVTSISANGALLSNLTGANVTGTVANATYATTAGSATTANTAGTVTSNAQSNITSVGTLSSLSVSGNAGVGNLEIGSGSGGSLIGANLLSANYITGTITTNAQPNITSVGTLSTLSVSGSANAGSVSTSGNVTAAYFIGNGSQLTGLSAGSANTAETVTNAAQPNITSVGTLSSLSVSGTANITGNVRFANSLAVGGNATSGIEGEINALYFSTTPNSNPGYAKLWIESPADQSVDIAQFRKGGNALVVIDASGNVGIGTASPTSALDVSGNANVGNIFANNASFTLVTGTITTNAQPNITSLGNLTDLNVAGNAVITGNLVVTGNTTYVNVETVQVQDPIIELGGGPNGAPLTTNDGKDRGTLLHYYNGGAIDAFMGWDNSNGEFAFGSNVTLSSDIVTFNTLGNVRASTFIGDLTGTASFATTANSVAGANVSGEVAFAATANSVAGANVSGEVAFAATANSVAGSNVSGAVSSANTAGTVTTNAQSNITSLGTLTGLTVDGLTSLGSVSNVSITGGSSGDVLTTDGTGNLSWTPVASTAGTMFVNSTPFSYNSSGIISAFTLPANAIVDTVSIIVDTVFDGTSPTINVGLTSNQTLYAETGDSDLKTAGRYDIPSQVAPVGTTGNIELYYTASSSNAGGGRVVITYTNPN